LRLINCVGSICCAEMCVNIGTLCICVSPHDREVRAAGRDKGTGDPADGNKPAAASRRLVIWEHDDFLMETSLGNISLYSKFHILPHTLTGPSRVRKDKASELHERKCLRIIRNQIMAFIRVKKSFTGVLRRCFLSPLRLYEVLCIFANRRWAGPGIIIPGL
jgi:hypothetical protein